MIESTVDAGIAVVTLSHGKVNAMSLEFVTALNEKLNSLESAENVEQVIIAGNERVFSAGVDLKRVIDEDNTYLDQFLPELIRMFSLALEFKKPLIAAITGHAIAGGCVLACAADYRVISRRARIGVPELRVGVPFPTSGMEIMRWAATPQAFRKMINTGATYTGNDAVAAGLADESADHEGVMDAARKATEPFAVVSPDVFLLTKRQMRQPVLDRIDRGEELFGEQINQLWRAGNTREAVTGYVKERLK